MQVQEAWKMYVGYLINVFFRCTGNYWIFPLGTKQNKQKAILSTHWNLKPLQSRPWILISTDLYIHFTFQIMTIILPKVTVKIETKIISKHLFSWRHAICILLLHSCYCWCKAQYDDSTVYVSVSQPSMGKDISAFLHRLLSSLSYFALEKLLVKATGLSVSDTRQTVRLLFIHYQHCKN